MPRAYRIVSPKYPSFDGTGTPRWGSRWMSPGRWVVHAAVTYSLAVLENLVHWQSNILPSHLVCVEVEIPDAVKQERLNPASFAQLALGDFSACRAIGDDWYDRGDSAILWVPSIVSPYESNLLFNQLHDDFRAIVVHDAHPARVDQDFAPIRAEYHDTVPTDRSD